MDIVPNFKRYLKNDYFDVIENQNTLSLKENKGKPYTITINVRKESKFIIIKDIEILKINDAKYVKEAPKDCDYIIIDLLNKIVYLIELKDTEKTNTEMMKQILAGEKWLNHILFCCQCESEIESLEYRYVGIRYLEVRPPKRHRPHPSKGPLQYIKDVMGRPYYRLQGKEFNLDSIYPI